MFRPNCCIILVSFRPIFAYVLGTKSGRPDQHSAWDLLIGVHVATQAMKSDEELTRQKHLAWRQRQPPQVLLTSLTHAREHPGSNVRFTDFTGSAGQSRVQCGPRVLAKASKLDGSPVFSGTSLGRVQSKQCKGSCLRNPLEISGDNLFKCDSYGMYIMFKYV